MPWNLKLADHVAIGEGVNVYNFATVSIGRMTVVSQFTHLCTGSHDHERADMPLTYAPITIGEQAWVATDVYVSPGVTIADGAVVGARSVVIKSLLEPWTVYAGHPCRKIKPRNPPKPLPLAPREAL
jgi:putative colanic acid biosynthesis acetyltransferase WcaF